MSDEAKSDDLPDTQPTDVARSTKPLPVQGKKAKKAEAATDVVDPVPAAEVPSEPEVVVVRAPKKKRRRWPWVLGAILLVLAVLLTIAFFVAEAYAKDYARQYIKDRIIAVLGIEEGTPVTVDIGDGSVLLQALRGQLDQIDVTAEQVSFGILKGSATVHAQGVPLDQNAPVEKLDVSFAVDEADVAALAGNLSGLQLESITLEEPEIVATTTFNFFGFQIPVGMGIEPSADEGQIVFTPTSIRLGEDTYTAEELQNTFGGFADQLLKQQSFCVAESLPAALTIVDVDVAKKDLIVKINGDGAALGGTDLTTAGVCPA
ncbi:MAG: DUF2993 domain-containing protein [Pseudolysinimonas sp.]